MSKLFKDPVNLSEQSSRFFPTIVYKTDLPRSSLHAVRQLAVLDFESCESLPQQIYKLVSSSVNISDAETIPIYSPDKL